MSDAPQFPDVRTAAQVYISRGFAPVPIPARKKGPIIHDWQNENSRFAAADFEPGQNAGIRTGAVSGGIADVDVDCLEARVSAERWLPPTGMRYGRPSRPSSHYLFDVGVDAELRRDTFRDPLAERDNAMLLELRGNGHQSMAPPSIHPGGETVAWEIFESPGRVELAELRHICGRVAAAALLARHWKSGERHEACLALSGFLLRRGWTEEETEDLFDVMAEIVGANRPKVQAAVRDTARRLRNKLPATGGRKLKEFFPPAVTAASFAWLGLDLLDTPLDEARPAMETSAMKPGEELPAAVPLGNLTDLSNARLFVSQHKADIRYDYVAKGWKIFDGVRWVRDPTGHVERLAKRTVESLFLIAAAEPDEARRDRLRRHALKSQDGRRIESLLKLARSEAEVATTSDAFDQDPWLLNCQNGTIDLRTGVLRPHDREEMLTKLAAVRFDPDATSPIWDSFLHRIMAPELAEFLQRAAGYSLTGDAREQKWFVGYGCGANGKSTFLRTLQSMLGDYAASTSMETLVAKRGGGATNDLARLAGARFVTAVEAEEGQRLAEERIKQMTGGDVITARFLYQEHFEFRPTFKLWIATNHRLNIRGTDHATWRRINEIPFTVSIPDNEQDRELAEKLHAERSGILGWAVAGCLQWQAQGLQEPPAVRAATADYRRQEDLIGAFLEDSCYLDAAARTPSRELYAAYQAYCVRTGERSPLSQMKLAPKLRERGLTPDRDGTTGRMGWLGIGLEPLSEGI